MPRPINRASDMNIMKLIERYDSDDKCRLTLEKLRWPLGVRCIRCDSEKVYRAEKRKQFECAPCGYHFSVTTGTIFHDTHLPLAQVVHRYLSNLRIQKRRLRSPAKAHVGRCL